MSSYMTRALQSSDPRFARILEKLGHKNPEQPKKPAADLAVSALREEYEAVVGKRPFMGWDADKLREKIAEAKAVATTYDDDDESEF